MILVMPFGSTGSFTDKEWANGVGRTTAWETFVARDVVHAVDAPLPDDPQRRGARARRALRGRLRRAQHRHPPSAASSASLESWSGYERADRHRRDLRPPRTRCCGEQPALDARRARRRRSARAHTYFWFYSGHRRPRSARRTPRSPQQLDARSHLPHRFFVVRGGHNWALWRGNAVARATSRPRGGFVARRARGRSRSCSLVVARGDRLAVPRQPPLPGPRDRRRTAARRARAARRRRRSSGTSSSGRGAAARSALYARWARIDRLTAALLLGARRRLWATCRAASRSRSCGRSRCATRSTRPTGCKPVYLPAALVGARRSRRSRAARPRPPRAAPRRDASSRPARARTSPRVLPGDDAGLLHSLTPDAVGPLARAAGALSGGRAARRGARPRAPAPSRLAGRDGRRRRSRRPCTSCTASTTARSPRRVVLVAAGRAPPRLRPPGRRRDAHAVARAAHRGVPSIALYALLALWLNRMAADQPLTLRFALRETIDGLFGVNLRGSPHLAGPFGDWFPLSLLLLGIGATALGRRGLARSRGATASCRRSASAPLARALVHAWGVDTLAPFVLRSDKSYFFTRRRSRVPRLPRRQRRRDRLGRPDRPARRLDELIGALRRARASHATGGSRSSARPNVPAALCGARPARALPRRRGGRRHRVVLARRARDPQGAPVGAPARARGLRGARRSARARSTQRLRARARGGRRRLARRRARARVRDGARRAVRAR